MILNFIFHCVIVSLKVVSRTKLVKFEAKILKNMLDKKQSQ